MIRESKTRIEFGKNNREEFAGMNDAFPCECIKNESWRFIGNEVPWHWHEYMEFNYILEGEIAVKSPDQGVSARKGDMVFINSNILHCVEFPMKSRYISCLFDMHLLSGGYNSAIEQKYFAPILRSHGLQVTLFHPDSPRRVRMMENMISMIEVMGDEPLGFEIFVREKLSRLWLQLFEETADIRASDKVYNDQDAERVKQMLAFIYEHYQEQISLEDIAASADISPRECTRCFRRSVGRPPIRFLIDYRVHMAAQKLLLTGDSVSLIAETCGFNSDNYFAKTFRETFGCTPREYRKKQ